MQIQNGFFIYLILLIFGIMSEAHNIDKGKPSQASFINGVIIGIMFALFAVSYYLAKPYT